MITPREWSMGDYTVSSDATRLQLGVIHQFLAGSYWAGGISLETVERSVAGSVAFGVYQGQEQVGFARVITDLATFAYLADVFVLEQHRGRGIARWLVRCIQETPELQSLRRWLLVTRDAHAIYRSVGFLPVANPENLMEIVRKDAYLEPTQPSVP